MNNLIVLQDLRSGNILEYDTKETEGWLPTVIDWQDLKWLEQNPDDFNRVHRPINLDEEWLKNLGFIQEKFNAEYIGITYGSGEGVHDFILTKPFVLGDWQKNYIFQIDGGRFVEVKYVHKLQNLFYELTATSLIVQL